MTVRQRKVIYHKVRPDREEAISPTNVIYHTPKHSGDDDVVLNSKSKELYSSSEKSSEIESELDEDVTALPRSRKITESNVVHEHVEKEEFYDESSSDLKVLQNLLFLVQIEYTSWSM